MVNNQPSAHVDLREHLAAERTFLAYIRTGLALMGFGFVVARFSLFLRELPLATGTTDPPTTGLSLWFGTVLVLLGVLLNLISVRDYRRLIERLNRAHSADLPSAKLPIFTALVTAGCGAVMVLHLIWLG